MRRPAPLPYAPTPCLDFSTLPSPLAGSASGPARRPVRRAAAVVHDDRVAAVRPCSAAGRPATGCGLHADPAFSQHLGCRPASSPPLAISPSSIPPRASAVFPRALSSARALTTTRSSAVRGRERERNRCVAAAASHASELLLARRLDHLVPPGATRGAVPRPSCPRCRRRSHVSAIGGRPPNSRVTTTPARRRVVSRCAAAVAPPLRDRTREDATRPRREQGATAADSIERWT